MTIAMNVLKEKTRRKDFYIIAVLGIGITLLLCSASSSIMIGGVPITTFKGLFPVATALLSGIACALAIALSLGTIPNEYKRQTSHLVWVRGIQQFQYHTGLAVGNIVASMFGTLVLYGGLVLFVVLEGELLLLPRLAVAFLFTCIPVAICSMVASALSLKLPFILAGIASVSILLFGIMHPLLETFSKMVSGFGGASIRGFLAVMPNLYALQNQACRFVLAESIDGHVIVSGLLFMYAASLLLVMLKRKEA